MAIFRMYHEEKWMVNDAILENALLEVEEEMKYGKVKKSERREVQTLVLPGGGCQEEHANLEDVTKVEAIEEDDMCITEDELWERDVFEENPVCSSDYL